MISLEVRQRLAERRCFMLRGAYLFLACASTLGCAGTPGKIRPGTLTIRRAGTQITLPDIRIRYGVVSAFGTTFGPPKTVVTDDDGLANITLYVPSTMKFLIVNDRDIVGYCNLRITQDTLGSIVYNNIRPSDPGGDGLEYELRIEVPASDVKHQ